MLSSKSTATNFSSTLSQFYYVTTHEWWNHGLTILFPSITSHNIEKLWKSCGKVCDTKLIPRYQKKRDEEKKWNISLSSLITFYSLSKSSNLSLLYGNIIEVVFFFFFFFFFWGRINDLYDLWIKYHIFLLFFSFFFLFFIEDNMSKAFIFLFFYFFSILNIKWRRSNVIWFHRISMSSQNLWLYYYMSKSQIKSKWHTFSCFDGWWEKY